jgi:hypothetical protein
MPTFTPHQTSGPGAAADEFYAPIIPLVVELHQQGLSLRKIAAELDRRELRTRQICMHRLNGTEVVSTTYFSWNAAQIGRILDRAGVPRTKRPRSGTRPPAAGGVADAPIVQQRRQPARQRADSAPADLQAAAPRQVPSAQNARPLPPAVSADINLFMSGKPCGPFTRAQVQAMLDAGTATLDTPAFRNVTDVWVPLRKLLGPAYEV